MRVASCGMSASTMEKWSAMLVEVANGDKNHTVLQCPDHIPDNAQGITRAKPFNLVMLDASGSMSAYFTSILHNWNKIIAPILRGSTKIFVFGSKVSFQRNEPYLCDSDLLQQNTNLTEAIRVIGREIVDAPENFIRLFLITDGAHNASQTSPQVEIDKLYVPNGKTVEVYLLALGSSFSVEYSITIRSALHNGNANVPSLFWDEVGSELSIREQLLSIADVLKKGSILLDISPCGYLAPGFPSTSTCHLGEHIYFPTPVSEILSSLKLSVGESPLALDIEVVVADHNFFMEKLFRQWNSIAIQEYRNKGNPSLEVFDVMKNIVSSLIAKLSSKVNATSGSESLLTTRLANKRIRSLQLEFDALMNQSKNVIEIEGKYESELELAKSILKTTVKSKYDTINLKMKGYGMDDYAKDMTAFRVIFENNKDKIMSLPEPSVDECCRVTLSSFVKDLQDPEFEELLKEDKFTFMKTVSVTGVPIYAPVKDSSQINPWTLVIIRILKSPYTIISQTTLELSAGADKHNSESVDKEIFLQEGKEDSKFNAVVPLFSQEVADVLKPLLRTNIFAMLSTFCILKNPHIVDHNAHLAALGCTWIEMIKDHPKPSRPGFATDLISMIETTANIYIDSESISKYLEILLTAPASALMTESLLSRTDSPIKCESLIKPLFLLYLARKKAKMKLILPAILPLLITEFLGRCIPAYSSRLTELYTYSTLFAPELRTQDNRSDSAKNKLKDVCDEIIRAFKPKEGTFVSNYYTLNDLIKDLNEFCEGRKNKIEVSPSKIQLNTELINKFKNSSCAGNIKLNTLVTFAQEMGMEEDCYKEIFSEKKMFIYLVHALNYRASRDRMRNPLPSEQQAREKVEWMVKLEEERFLKESLKDKVVEEATLMWKEEFLSTHSTDVIIPMTKSEIIQAATKRGIDVNEENFRKIYIYRRETGLLRNACMVEGCPYYLLPRRNFNSHISVERKGEYLHQMHQVAQDVAMKGGDVEEVVKILLEKRQGRLHENDLPPKPSPQNLEKLKEGIVPLLAKYAKFNR